MNPRSASPALSCRADSVFDQLVDELIAQLQAGAAPDWSALTREHPDHVNRLRNMAQTLEALDDLSSADDLALSGVAPLTVAEGHIAGLLGDFRIVREVGRGGMGVVYEAEQVSLNRRVALKVLPLAATLDPRQLQRFRHEARAAGLLHHSHIVPVYGVGCERGIHYYAMQLIEGCSLANVIALWRGSGEEPNGSTCAWAKSDALADGADTPSPAARATIPSLLEGKPFRPIAELVAQAADALEYAHAMGVVHRDVKPANLLLDAGGTVWVTDFGLARLGEGPGLTVSGDLLGTLRYMSPEQALAKHGLVDHRTDIYSLGATLYELLTRRPAVDGASKEEVLHRLAFAEPVAPRKLDRSIPAELETVTLKAMAKDPGERYATAQELADDLQRWLTNRPIMARPPGLFQRLRKWSHRHRPLVVVMGVSVVLVTVALCLGAVEYGIKKGELADERSRLADDKDRSKRVLAEQLHQVLVDRAETARLARSPGYRRQIWTGLRQAIALRTGEEKADQIRATVLASLADPVGLDPVHDPNVVRRQTHPDLPARVKAGVREAANRNLAVVSLGGDVVAAVESNSRVAVYGYDTDPFRQEESPLGAVYELALAADGKTLAAGCEQGFFAWNLAGQDRWLVRGGNVISVAISPNGRLLAIAGRQIELWSLATKRLIASWPAPEAGAHVEFSADGRVLLGIAKGEPVAGWPVSDTPERRVFDGHTQGVPAVVFSPDGRQLVSVSRDRTVRVWDAATGRPLRTLTGHAGEIEAVTFNPNGSLLATGDLAGTVRVWDFAFGRLLAEVGRGEPPGQIWRLQFGPGGEYLVAAGRHLVVWTVLAAADQVRLERLCTLAAMPDSPGVIDVVARPGGSELIYLNRGGRLYTYDLAQVDDSRLLADARAAVRSLHFTPTGDRLTFVSAGGTLGLWEWETKAAADTHRRAESVAVSADGRWAAVGGPGQSVTVAELISGRSVLTLPPEGSDVWCLAWSPDGTRLAVGLSDGTVAVWDLEQVRARLAEFGFDSPSTANSRGPAVAAPIPAFDRIIQLNRMRAEAEKSRRLAKSARDEGDQAAERDHLVTALNLDERLAETVPNAPGHRKRLASTHGALGRALARLGNIDSALRHLDLEAKLVQQLLVEHRGNVEYRRLLAAQRTGRSKVLDQAKRMAEAVDDARRAVADRTELAADPGTPLDREQLAVAYGNLGLELTSNAQWAEAEVWYRAALTAFDRLATDSPTQADTPSFRAGRGSTLNNLGILLTRGKGDSNAAEKPLREAVAIRTQLADEFPANPDYTSDLGRTLEWLAGMLRAQRRFDESLRLFREANRRQAVALELRPKNQTFLELRCKHQAQIADTFLQMGHAVDAAAEARELQRLAPGDPAVLVRASCLFVTCTRLTQEASDLPWPIGLALSRAYQIEAVALLRQAAAKGLANPIQVLGDPVLDPVRNCEEFRLLLHEVNAHRH